MTLGLILLALGIFVAVFAHRLVGLVLAVIGLALILLTGVDIRA